MAHVAHVPLALRIVEDSRLRADLVFDESKLNTERIRVVWLSPNDWEGAGGFRYGNIRFHFDWAKLVEGKRVFWVESIAYGIPACRVLLTDVDYTGTLEVYDPTSGDGPWWQSPSGEHYWNGEYCLEVMVEGDLGLGRAMQVDFVKHHEKRCSIDYRSCPYCGTSRFEGGAEFLAALASRCPTFDLPGLVVDNDEGRKPSWSLLGAVGVLLRGVTRAGKAATGSIKRTDPGGRALARAILATFANRGVGDDVSALAAHFSSTGDAEGAVADALADAVGLPDAAALMGG